MSVPNFANVARATFESFPADIAALRQVCDETDLLRSQVGGDDPRVQAGEVRANNLKGLFTRRIAWACHQLNGGFGLRRKTIGQRATRPVDGLEHSTDVLMWHETGHIVDVMSDRNWSWLQNDADTQPIDQWVLPLPEAGISAPDIPIVPPPLPMDPDLRARVQSLEATSNVQAQLIREQIARIDQLRQRVQTLEELTKPQVVEPAPPFELPALVAVGRIKTFGLNIPIRLPVERA